MANPDVNMDCQTTIVPVPHSQTNTDNANTVSTAKINDDNDESNKDSSDDKNNNHNHSTLARVHSLSSEWQRELQRRATAATNSFKRPRTWVLIFGWSLALCAGIVNVVAYRSWGTYVSHMTGDTTAIGMRIEGVHQRDTQFEELNEAVFILLSFLFGAFLCGILIDKNQVHFGGKSFYGLALVGNSVLLIIATFQESPLLAGCITATACGLQNAMCTSHFGAVVRTTHVTGTATDIGSTLGRITMIFLRNGCRRSSMNVLDSAEVGVDARKLLVLAPMLLCFLAGTVTGAYLHTLVGVYALLIPATLTGVVGLLYTLFRQRLKGYLRHIESDRLNKDFEKVQGAVERAQMMISAFKRMRQLGKFNKKAEEEEEGVVIELEEGFEDMLERMRDLEEGLESFYQSPRSSLSGSSHRHHTASNNTGHAQ